MSPRSQGLIKREVDRLANHTHSPPPHLMCMQLYFTTSRSLYRIILSHRMASTAKHNQGFFETQIGTKQIADYLYFQLSDLYRWNVNKPLGLADTMANGKTINIYIVLERVVDIYCITIRDGICWSQSSV